MKAATWTDEASANELLTEGQEQEIVVLRDGKPVAVVTPFDDDDLEWYGRERDPAFLESLKRAREEIASGQAVSHGQLKSELGV
jgi:PHD/YefM family antitoxin component YafN of YafNO toxin-antitoxin module